LLSFKCATRLNEKQKPELTIQSNMNLKLKLTWSGGSGSYDIKVGSNKI